MKPFFNVYFNFLNVRIPLVTVHKDMDGTEDIDVSSNPHDFVTLDTKNLPVLVTVTTVSRSGGCYTKTKINFKLNLTMAGRSCH